MKMKKDEKLDKILTEYSTRMPLPEGIAEDAKRALALKNTEKKRKPAFRAAWIFAVILFCAVISVMLLNNTGKPNFDGNNSAGDGGGTAPAGQYYTSAEIKFRKSTKQEAALLAAVDFGWLEGKNVISENYYSYEFKNDGSAAFILAEIAYQNGYGRTDISLIIELTDKYYTELTGYKTNRKIIEGEDYYVFGETIEIKGEYVTKAFTEKYYGESSCKLYISVQCPAFNDYSKIREIINNP